MNCPKVACRVARLLAFLAASVLGSVALPASAKSMFYVMDHYDPSGSVFYTSSAWYVVLKADGKARLSGAVGARTGTYTDNGAEILATLAQPLSYLSVSAPDADCGYEQHIISIEVQQVLFRRVAGTNASKGKSQVVELGRIFDSGNDCKPAGYMPFGSVLDPGITMSHRSSAKREPMTDVTAGLTIAGFSEVALPFGYEPYFTGEADVVTFDAPATVRFQRSGHVVNASFNPDQWLVLDTPSPQIAYTRFSTNAGTGAETWFMAKWQDGKPQALISTLMFKPIPGASFGTKAQTSRMWEYYYTVGTDNLNFFYMYGNYAGDRVSKDLVAATESRSPFTWRYDMADVFMSRMVGTTLSERRWAPLGRVGKNMWVMEQEQRTPAGQVPYAFIPSRVVYFIDRGAATPPAP